MAHPSRLGCISDASLRRLIQRLRDILKRADLQVSETPPGRLIKDVSLETSLRSSGFLRKVFELSLRLQFIAFKLKHFLATCLSTYKSLNIFLK